MNLFSLFKRQKPKLSGKAEETIRKIAIVSFPGGEKQISAETDQLFSLLDGKLSKPEVRHLLCRTKALLVTASDRSEERVIASTLLKLDGKLSREECKLAYKFITGLSGSLYGGGNGATKEFAVKIETTFSPLGIHAEYEWISSKFGKQERDWFLEMRVHCGDEGKTYEVFHIKLSNGESATIHFDITSFYGNA